MLSFSIFLCALLALFHFSSAAIATESIKFSQCRVSNKQYSTDRKGSPVTDAGRLTLNECRDMCRDHKDSFGRQCIAVEWRDFGTELKSHTRRRCYLAWGCDTTFYWKAGSVYYVPITTSSPTLTRNHAPSSSPTSFPSIKSGDCLEGVKLSFTGECNYSNFLNKIESYGCKEEDSYLYLSSINEFQAKSKFEEICDRARNKTKEEFFQFKDISKGGYQFDREFMNGGSAWNNEFDPNLSQVKWVEDNILTRKGITFPNYLHNFDIERSCEERAAICCWTSDSSIVGEGSCNKSEGCQNAKPLDNTDVCYIDIKDSSKASHTKYGIAVYPDNSEGSTNCMGFTWSADEQVASNLYKGNTLFEISMRYGLKDNGYTKSIPHAPMCGCIDQMPVISKADCKDIEASHTWSFEINSDTKDIDLWESSVDLNFNDCSGNDLASHYKEIHNKDISHRITGECQLNEASFLEKGGLVRKEDHVIWVKVAGKGVYAEPNNPTHKEQHLGGTHTSMTRSDFETLWNESNGVLLRRCKFCKSTHRYIYLKRHDMNGLPSNVDLLNMVKSHWYQSENNIKHEDFDLYTTYDDAVRNTNHWKFIDSNDRNVGFPRNSGPFTAEGNQWNTWDTPVAGRFYGQRDIAFYIAMPYLTQDS